MNMRCKALIFSLALIIGGAGVIIDGKMAKAEKYPAKAMTLVLFGDAGGPLDVQMRLFGKVAEKYLGQPTVILNKPAGNGVEWADYLMKAPMDGYTLGSSTTSLAAYMLMPAFKQKPDDLDYVGIVLVDAYMLAVKKESPFKTWNDVVNFARNNPGKLTCAGVRVGSTHHQNFAALIAEAGIDIVWMPTKGGNEALTTLLGGHTDLGIGTPGNTQAMIAAGKLRPLVLFDTSRSPLLPDMPTCKDLGYKFTPIAQTRGIVVKKGFSKEKINILANAYQKVVSDPEFIKFSEKQGLKPTFIGPDEMEKWFRKAFTDTQVYLKKVKIIR